jgi:AcrR family transcriptional regulator
MAKTNNRDDFKKLDKSLRLQKIIDTAIALFHINGYRATTLEDVSKELGITKAALYHYVSNKEKLLSIIYIQALENIFKNIGKISNTDIPADEKLRLIIRNHVKGIIIQNLPLFSVFFSEENQLPEADYKKIQKEKEKYTDIVEEIINQGISEGLFRKTDPKLQAYGIIGMCNWIYKWYGPGRTQYTPDQVADHFISFLESGYLNKKSVGNESYQSKKKENDLKAPLLSSDDTLGKLKTHCLALSSLIDEIIEDDV